jgi:P-type Cu+ transporter
MESIDENLDPRTSDPVCGRHMTEAQALLRAEYEGTTYLFCSERCRMLFALHPGEFALGEGRPRTDEAITR